MMFDHDASVTILIIIVLGVILMVLSIYALTFKSPVHFSYTESGIFI